jgi:hypothetical protein
MNPVIVRMSGGLGNQLFQYAAGRSLALRLGAPLQLDISQFNSGKNKRAFELAALAAHYATADNVGSLNAHAAAVMKWHKRTRRISALNRIVHHLYADIYLEEDFRFPRRWQALSSPKYLVGNFISARFFSEHANFIRQDLTALRGAEIPASEHISIHVRLTDYISGSNPAKFKGSCDASYYRHAVAHFKSLYPKARFLVFSDDVNAARKILSGDETIAFHNDIGETPIETMLQMAACQHHIIANSTFSWWAAWLNPNISKQVIAPRHWFSRRYGRKHDLGDILPPSWLTLDNDSYTDASGAGV